MIIRFDSPLHEAAVRSHYPLHDAAGSQIIPLHDAARSQVKAKSLALLSLSVDLKDRTSSVLEANPSSMAHVNWGIHFCLLIFSPRMIIVNILWTTIPGKYYSPSKWNWDVYTTAYKADGSSFQCSKQLVAFSGRCEVAFLLYLIN